MNLQTLDAKTYALLIKKAAYNLSIHAEEINNLNVFPIPDGDTGDNMLLTMNGGVGAIPESIEGYDLSKLSAEISSGMLLGARGNSGVILSQFFFGISEGFKGLKEADIQEVCTAFKSGVKHAYEAVMTPVEGTILTVAKDSTEYAVSTPANDLLEFIENFIREAKLSLNRTPDLLPVLKKAGVVDSGGAGLIYIMKGMRQVLRGDENIENPDLPEHTTPAAQKSKINLDAFDENSVLEFGYCTELMLRLQNAKCDPQSFSVETIKSFLDTIGNSVVAFKTGTIIKIHVHTMTPDKVLAFCQQFGEFLTVKIENMSLQHNSNNMDEDTPDKTEEVQEHKKYGIVAVASGDGIKASFKEYGADYIVEGGQSMNPSAQDFITAFNKVNADTIFVLPNNGNVILAAKQAASMYKNSDIRVIETHSIGDGYAVLTMYDPEAGSTEEIVENLNMAMEGVSTYYISHCVRDAEMDGIQLHSGDYIGFLDKAILTTASLRDTCTKQLIDKIDFTDHEICLCIRGKDAPNYEFEEMCKYLKSKHPNVELYPIEGGQDIYSYIFIIE